MNQAAGTAIEIGSKPFLRSRAVILTIGMVNIALFLLAISWLYLFLFTESTSPSRFNLGTKILIDLGLLSFMSFPHSFLLEAKWKRNILKVVPSELFFTVYSLHASISLITLFYFWQPIGFKLYELHGILRYLVWGLNILSWFYMGLALYSTGALKHNGVEQWWNELHGRKTKYHQPYELAYKQVRHPIFLAFFLMIWIVPQMTVGRLLVACYWSLYLIVGTIRKEDKLLRNKNYQKYAREVAPYPFFPKRAFKEVFNRGRK